MCRPPKNASHYRGARAPGSRGSREVASHLPPEQSESRMSWPGRSLARRATCENISPAPPVQSSPPRGPHQTGGSGWHLTPPRPARPPNLFGNFSVLDSELCRNPHPCRGTGEVRSTFRRRAGTMLSLSRFRAPAGGVVAPRPTRCPQISVVQDWVRSADLAEDSARPRPRVGRHGRGQLEDGLESTTSIQLPPGAPGPGAASQRAL